MQNRIEPQASPYGSLLVTEPSTGEQFNVGPLFYLLFERYSADKDYLVEALEEVSHYLVREEGECDSARQLKRVLAIVTTLTTAFDSITVQPRPKK